MKFDIKPVAAPIERHFINPRDKLSARAFIRAAIDETESAWKPTYLASIFVPNAVKRVAAAVGHTRLLLADYNDPRGESRPYRQTDDTDATGAVGEVLLMTVFHAADKDWEVEALVEIAPKCRADFVKTIDGTEQRLDAKTIGDGKDWCFFNKKSHSAKKQQAYFLVRLVSDDNNLPDEQRKTVADIFVMRAEAVEFLREHNKDIPSRASWVQELEAWKVPDEPLEDWNAKR